MHLQGGGARVGAHLPPPQKMGLLFSPYSGTFSPFRGFFAAYSPYFHLWRAFCFLFSSHGGPFSLCGGIFSVYEGPFFSLLTSTPPPPPTHTHKNFYGRPCAHPNGSNNSLPVIFFFAYHFYSIVMLF